MLWKMLLNVCKELAASRTESDFPRLEINNPLILYCLLLYTELGLQWESVWISAARSPVTKVIETYLGQGGRGALGHGLGLEELTIVTVDVVEC